MLTISTQNMRYVVVHCTFVVSLLKVKAQGETGDPFVSLKVFHV